MNKYTLIHPEWSDIRTKVVAGTTYFVAMDICHNLDIANHKDAISEIDRDEKAEVVITDLSSNGVTQRRSVLAVNESGLYSLIFKSRKPQAKKFRKWVTNEVLPSIRKYGYYTIDPNVISREEKKIERLAVKKMLEEIKGMLSQSDRKMIAKQCRCTDYYIYQVLDGDVQDEYMMSLMYARATGNRLLKQHFYTRDGAMKMVESLQSGKSLEYFS